MANEQLNHALYYLLVDQLMIPDEFKDPSKDILSLVQASQALELLGETPKADLVCKAINKQSKTIIELMTVNHCHAFNVAEANRIFKCDSLKGVPGIVETIFIKDVNTHSSPNSLH